MTEVACGADEDVGPAGGVAADGADGAADAGEAACSEAEAGVAVPAAVGGAAAGGV